MIVVIGSPVGRIADGVIVAAGMASRVALAAAAAGRSVQVVGRTGDDPTADGVVLDLARGGVGHVALLRDPARATPVEAAPADEPIVGGGDTSPSQAQPEADGPAIDAADVDLGLRYLTEFAVVVLAEPSDPAIVAIVSDAARWGEARMILVLPPGEPVPAGLPSDAVVLEAPVTDPDGAFAAVVGTLAAALDDGGDPGAAFRAAIAADGWTPTSDVEGPD